MKQLIEISEGFERLVNAVFASLSNEARSAGRGYFLRTMGDPDSFQVCVQIALSSCDNSAQL